MALVNDLGPRYEVGKPAALVVFSPPAASPALAIRKDPHTVFGWLRRLFGGTLRTPGDVPSGGTAAGPPPSLSGLDDVGRFAPLSEEAVHRALWRSTGGLGRLWNLSWLGRRDRIPPASDPQTQLIDRAMVGQGLITPERLEEIHSLGTAMDQLRPAYDAAAREAQQAVEADRQQRAQRRSELRAESAQRKQQRTKAIADRRANDIVFLGRGVSAGLADRNADLERLASRDLPLLATPAELATALGITIPRLRWLAFHSEAATCTHYVSFTIPKRSGGVRRLSAPHRALRGCQKWILTEILARVTPHEAAHGFVPGRSIVTNATPHVAARLVLNADLADFFPSIGFGRVAGVFKWLGYSPAVSTILGLLCTESPRREIRYAGTTYYTAIGKRGLPQGACTSPSLSNLVSYTLDCRLQGLATRIGWNYSRYADDLTLSYQQSSPVGVGYVLARLRHIVADEGFVLNAAKTRVLRPNARQTVTGVVVNDRPGVSRHIVRRLRAILHRAKYEGLAAQNRDDHPHFESWLRGMISYVAMVNPEQGARLRAEYLRVSEQE